MSVPFYPFMDIPQELSPSEPAPISCQQEKEFWENDIPKETNDFTPTTKENDIPNESNGFTPIIKENDELTPVPPGSAGEGLPYAPIDWPNPGDNWSWRVGRRTNAAGYYHDRFLNLPKSLHKRSCPKQFASKPSLERFIQSEFPGADINAFFASFSWKIPTTLQPGKNVEAASPLAEILPEGETEKVQNEGKEGIRRTQRKRTERPKETPKPKETPRTSQRKRKEKPASVPVQSNQKSRRSSRASVKHTGGAVVFSLNDEPESACEPPVEINPEEFDNYLSSLDDLLAQPPSEGQLNVPATISSPVREDEISEARMKLSSLLDMDFPSLVFFQDLSELTNLASKVRKDPRLTAEQLVKLKLIEEMPSFSEVYLENKGVVEQADQFFSALEFNKAKVTSLKNEYSELKDKVGQLQMEMDSNALTIQEIDGQIRLLQAQRAELTSLIKNKKKEKVDLNYSQSMVANSIPKFVDEIQLANSKKAEWELKKENALKREAEILAKFSPLKGFYL